MDLAGRLSAAAFWVLAAGVALHFIFTPFYDHLVDALQMWEIMDYFMAVGTALALLFHYVRKRGIDHRNYDGGVSREYLEANLLVYASVLLTVWFFWNWFDFVTIGEGVQDGTRSIMWAFIDPLFVIVAGVTGCCLWRSSNEYY